jgi:TRAP-type C4-dicarboxylate transport system substrate-binding protein
MFNTEFERFVKKLNKEGAGKLKINLLGHGAAVMHPFEMGKAVRDGVVDICSCPSSFYTKLFPEGYALKQSQYSIHEMRENGAFDYIEKVTNEKLNAHWLGRSHDEDVFQIYLAKKVDKPDLSGIKVRTAPLHRAFATALGATPVLLPPGQIYTALERGTVDGFIWTIRGIFDFSWHKFAKYRIEYPFYTAHTEIIINLDKWNTLDQAQKDLLEKNGRWIDNLNYETMVENELERKRQNEAGIKAIKFSDADIKKYLGMASDAGWDEVLKRAPKHGAKLKALLSGKGACDGGIGPHCISMEEIEKRAPEQAAQLKKLRAN